MLVSILSIPLPLVVVAATRSDPFVTVLTQVPKGLTHYTHTLGCSMQEMVCFIVSWGSQTGQWLGLHSHVWCQELNFQPSVFEEHTFATELCLGSKFIWWYITGNFYLFRTHSSFIICFYCTRIVSLECNKTAHNAPQLPCVLLS